MTLNGEMAVTLRYFTEFGSFGSKLRQSKVVEGRSTLSYSRLYMYVRVPANDAAVSLGQPLDESQPRLRLNESKTEIMWLGTSEQLDNIIIRNVSLLSTVVTVVDPARKTAVIIHSQLSQTHILLSVAAVTVY